MMKVVINNCFGGFSLSQEAIEYLAAKGHEYAITQSKSSYGACREIARDDPLLVEVVEVLGAKASGGCAALAVVEIPDDVKWQIEEYDGNEHVAEQHRTWY